MNPLNANVGSPESDVTLPYSPRPELVDNNRRASVDSFNPPFIKVIECEQEIRKESFAERIAAVDAAIEAQALKKQNKQNSRARHTDYDRSPAPSESVFRSYYAAPMRW